MTAYPDAQTQAPNFNKAWRSLANSRFWALMLLAIGTASNSIYAHAPLAAFATVSGVTLSRQRAIAIAVLIWLVNQVIGFGLRGYPLTVVAFTWGALMGLGTLLVTVGASWRPAFSRSTGAGHFGWMAIATLGGFVLYQGIIMLALPGLTEGHSMGWDIVGRLFLQQLTWVGAISLGHGLLLWRMLAATH